MNQRDFQDACAFGFGLLALGLLVLAVDRFGGLTGKTLIAAMLFGLSLCSIVMIYRIFGWRGGISATLLFASVWSRDVILISRAMMTTQAERMTSYPWYLSTVAYYCICFGLLASGAAFMAIVMLGREPDWMRELLD